MSTSLTVSSTTASETSISVIGTTPEYFDLTTAKVATGSSFTDADVTSAAKKAIIGQTLATELYPTGSALGQRISVDGTSFTVAGILATQSSSGLEDTNSVVIAPISRVQQSFTGFGAVSTLTVAATNSASVDAAQGELEVMLNQLLVIKTSDGTEKTVSTGDRTTVTATSDADLTDLKKGDTVRVVGATGDHGSVTATSISEGDTGFGVGAPGAAPSAAPSN